MTQEEKREKAKEHFDSLRSSWTYERMNETERRKWQELFNWVCNCGTLYAMRTEKEINNLINAVYHSYLIGIGYTNGDWRSYKEN